MAWKGRRFASVARRKGCLVLGQRKAASKAGESSISSRRSIVEAILAHAHHGLRLFV